MDHAENGSFLGGAILGGISSIIAKVLLASVLISIFAPGTSTNMDFSIVDVFDALPGAFVGGCILWIENEKGILGVIVGASAAMIAGIFGNVLVAIIVGFIAGACCCSD